MAMKPLRLALVIAVVATAAAAEEFDRKQFYLRDIRGNVQRLHRAEDAGDLSLRDLAALGVIRSQDPYSIVLAPFRDGAVTYTVTPEFIEDPSQTLRAAFQDTTKLETGLKIGSDTSLSFSDTSSVRSSVFGQYLSGSRVQAFGLSQGLGGGVSAGTMKFTRTMTATSPNPFTTVNRTSDDLEMAMGIAQGWGVNMKANRFASDEGATGVTGSSFASGLAMPFSGGAASLSYAASRQDGNGVSLRTEKFDAVLPVKFMGQKTDIAFGQSFQERNGAEARGDSFSVNMPLKLNGKDTKLAYATSFSNNFGAVSKARTYEFMLPFRLSGEDLQWSFSSLYQNNVGALTKSQNLGLRLPLHFLDDKATIEHASSFNYGKGVHTQTRRTAFATPVSLLGNDYKLSYLIQGDDVGEGVFEARTTTMEVPFQVDGKALPATWSLVRARGPVKGVATVSQKLDMSLPIDIGSTLATATHHLEYAYLNGVHTEVRDTKLAAPLKLFGKPGGLDYTIHGEDKGAGLAEARTAHLVSPFEAFGKQFGADNTFVTLQQGGFESRTLTNVLTAPLVGGTATVQRQLVESFSGETRSETRQMAYTLPVIKLSRNVAVTTAQRICTDTVGVGSNDVTTVGLTAQPLKPFTVEAKYTMTDGGTQAPTLTQSNILGKYALSGTTRLEGQLTESELPGAPANSLKILELVRDRGESKFGLRAGMVQYGAPVTPADDARRFEVNVGDPKYLAVTAAYSEFDPNNRTSLGDNPIIALALQHGTPEKFAVRYRYEDQPARVAPARGVDLAMPAFGGTFQVTYASNQLGADGKTVRLANQYDATLARKFGDKLALELGYRYLDCYAPDVVDQHMRVQLDGGKEDGWGKIALGYQTGDFVKKQDGQQLAAGSALDLNFSRSWSEGGKLTLTLMRRTAPMNTIADGTTEGRLEYRSVFW